jgi:hypothetical protein
MELKEKNIGKSTSATDIKQNLCVLFSPSLWRTLFNTNLGPKKMNSIQNLFQTMSFCQPVTFTGWQ